MRVRFLGIFLVLLTGWALAKPIGRVESLHGDKKLFRQQSAAAQPYLSHVEQDASIGNHFRTSPGSMASIRFFLGGNVGLGQGCEIEITSERDAKVIEQGNYWMKFDSQEKAENPVRIQTAGGVMGIRGTEFVLKVEGTGDNQTTELSLIEGIVDIETTDGKRFEARAEDEDGIRVTFGGGRELRYRLYKVEQLLDNLRKELPPEFYDLRETLRETRQAIRDAEYQIRLARMEEKLALKSTREAGREARKAGREAKRALRDAGIADGSIPGLEGLEALKNLENETEISDSKVEVEGPNRESQFGAHPSLYWPGAPEDKYSILILDPDDQSQVYWVDDTVGPKYVHPEQAEPLSPGAYIFRVIPHGPGGELEEAVDYEIEVIEDLSSHLP